MTDIQTWQEFFDGHAPHYRKNSFTQNTEAETALLLELLQLPSGSRLLDIGCGAGRHSVALALQGYRLTGVDISAGMLAEAQKAADAAGVEIEWIQEDATRFTSSSLFDGAFCLCEGAFCLIGRNEDPVAHDFAILSSVSRALKPGAPFVLTALNALACIRRFTQEDVLRGRFDPVQMVETLLDEMELPEGRRRVPLRLKHYVPPELVGLMRRAGFAVEHVWGGSAGNWGRRPVDLDEMEIMVVARKQTDPKPDPF
jgi:SAM-dependent methyltransferase